MWRRVELVEGERREIEIAVVIGPTLRGRVVDAKTGNPIANAEIGAGWTFRRPVRTDAAGEYVYAGFPLEGIYDLHVRAAGYGRAEQAVRGPDRDKFLERVDFELLPSRRAHGRVLDENGAPVPGAYVAAVGYEHTSDDRSKQDWIAALSAADGRFELKDLRPDIPHALLVRKEGFGTVVHDLADIGGTASSLDLADITLPPMSVIRGSIVDDSGEGVPDQLVTLHGWNSDRSTLSGGSAARPSTSYQGPGPDIYVGQRRARTDDLGRFSFADLSAGTYGLNVQRKGGGRQVAQDVEVPRAARMEGIRLVLPGGDGSIEGRVVDHLGKPVPKAIVRADLQDPPSGDGAGSETRADGSFVIRGLRPGTYRLRAEASFWSHEPGVDVQLAPSELRGLQPGQRDLEIVLRLGAWVRGRVFSADDQAVLRLVVLGRIVGSEDRRYAVTDEAGRFRMLVAEDDLVDLEVNASWEGGVPLEPETGTSSARASRVAPNQEEVILRLPKRP